MNNYDCKQCREGTFQIGLPNEVSVNVIKERLEGLASEAGWRYQRFEDEMEIAEIDVGPVRYTIRIHAQGQRHLALVPDKAHIDHRNNIAIEVEKAFLEVSARD